MIRTYRLARACLIVGPLTLLVALLMNLYGHEAARVLVCAGAVLSALALVHHILWAR